MLCGRPSCGGFFNRGQYRTPLRRNRQLHSRELQPQSDRFSSSTLNRSGGFIAAAMRTCLRLVPVLGSAATNAISPTTWCSSASRRSRSSASTHDPYQMCDDRGDHPRNARPSERQAASAHSVGQAADSGRSNNLNRKTDEQRACLFDRANSLGFTKHQTRSSESGIHGSGERHRPLRRGDDQNRIKNTITSSIVPAGRSVLRHGIYVFAVHGTCARRFPGSFATESRNSSCDIFIKMSTTSTIRVSYALRPGSGH